MYTVQAMLVQNHSQCTIYSVQAMLVLYIEPLTMYYVYSAGNVGAIYRTSQMHYHCIYLVRWSKEWATGLSWVTGCHVSGPLCTIYTLSLVVQHDYSSLS